MQNNKLTIEINKPLADVFAFCITPPKAKLWVPHIIDEKTNEWPVKIGTVYTEYKDDNTSFNIIVTDYKENDYIEWKTENDDYRVRYTFTPINQTTTQLEYAESGNIDKPFTQEVLEKLKETSESE